MAGKGLNIVHFSPREKGSFHEAVISRVKDYFKRNKISPYANTKMWVKTYVMFSLYFIPYVLIVTGTASGNAFLFFCLWFIMGWGMIGIGTSVMHDANHGTYSPRRSVNRIIGFILEVLGGYSLTWKIQHNYLHHTYTNITGLDEDLDSIKFLRFSPRQQRAWYHRYQYLYAWFFYMMMTLYWMTVKDYQQAFTYQRHHLLSKYKTNITKVLLEITFYKVIYYGYIIVLPVLFSGMPWYYVIFGFLLMHFTAGLVLSCIFQPSHIVEASTFELPQESDGHRKMEDSWAVHEVENTTDFAPESPVLTWFIGGLNFQIEHHLFTGICHVHYPHLAPIVRQTAKEHGVEYHVEPTFWKALWGHVKMLKRLGRE